jgi:uncharacterized membrane protein
MAIVASALVLAQAVQTAGDLRGWWIGATIGGVVVLVVAVVAITLIVLARRIARQTQSAIAALEHAEANTRALWDVGKVNTQALAVLEGAVRAREALEDAS